MKKFLMYGLSLAGVVLPSCQYTELISDVDVIDPKNPQTRLQVTIEEPAGSMMPSSTRAIVNPEDEEKNVADLRLLFFEYSADGSGEYVGEYVVPSTYLTSTYVDGEPFELEIGSGLGADLAHTARYSILAYANLTLPAPSGGTTENHYRQAILTADYATKFQTGGQLALPMSGETAKAPDQELVELKLTRLVARFDVRNLLEDYTVTSAGVFNAAGKTTVWESTELGSISGQTYVDGGAYRNTLALAGNGYQRGGLYAFENFVGDPLAAKDKTTALIIGLKKGGTGTEQFFRVDIHPDEEGQNLKKNHVYMVTVQGLTGAGESTWADAAADTKNPLDVTINNWAADEEGLILNDGTNLLVAPSRYIRFGPEAEVREYLIYTSGTGTLEITKRSLPDGVTVTLSGNTLRVEVTALPAPVDGYQEERTGSIELGYAGLRGSIQIVQSPRDDNYLFLDKKSPLPIWPSGGLTPNTVTVSSSGEWTAEIYNTSENDNPGFSFVGGAFTASGNDGDILHLVPTGGNPNNSVRNGFVVVTLKEDKKYRQVLVMQQEAIGTIEISPDYDPAVGLPFSASGFAKLVGTGTSQNYYRIDVLPGKDGSGKLNAWEASLSGAHANYFTLTKIEDPISPHIILSAKGQIGTTPGNTANPGYNIGALLDDCTLTIQLPGGTEPGAKIELPVTHDPVVFSVKRSSVHSRVPVMGVYEHVANMLPGTPGADEITGYVEYSINMPDGMTWEARITSQSHPNTNTDVWRRHEGFFLADDNSRVTTLSGQGPTKKLRVSFDKIYYPMVHWPSTSTGTANLPTEWDYNIPRVEIKVNITGFANPVGSVPAFAAEFATEQVPLTANAVDILNIYGAGSATANSNGAYSAISPYPVTNNNNNNYFVQYCMTLQSASNFGPSGQVRVGKQIITGAGGSITDMSANTTWAGNPSINPERNYVHAGGYNRVWHRTSHDRVEAWRKSSDTDGFLFILSDEVRTFSEISSYAGATLYDWSIYGYGGNEYAANGFGGDFAPGYGRYGPTAQANGASTETNVNRQAESLNADHADNRVMKYTLQGPFGATTIGMLDYAFGHDDIMSYAEVSTVTRYNPNATVLIKDRRATNMGHDHALLVVDPTARLAYSGDCEFFNRFGYDDTYDDGTTAWDSAKKIWRGNFISIFINSAMYGSHFYDLLRDDCPQPFYVIRGSTASPSAYSIAQIQ